MTRSKKCLSP
uniref:Uncharacterized protein n=1 Tax=Anguilla anguilla TaxID=7936 RepID=A0A0E9P5C8_ANGAN